MSDIAKDKAARLLKKRGSLSSLSSHGLITKGKVEKQKDYMSTVSYMDDPGHFDDIPRPAQQMENTYQLEGPAHLNIAHQTKIRNFQFVQQFESEVPLIVLEPSKHFPDLTVNNILKDVLTSYLQEEKYEPELCRQMTKTISEVIKAQVKDLMIPRYKIIVLIHIGQLNGQSMRIGSRFLWNTNTDTFSSFSFCNRSLFAVANVYGVYFE